MFGEADCGRIFFVAPSQGRTCCTERPGDARAPESFNWSTRANPAWPALGNNLAACDAKILDSRLSGGEL
eukprot:8998418-Alexandrium_andersonii.AAC.1